MTGRVTRLRHLYLLCEVTALSSVSSRGTAEWQEFAVCSGQAILIRRWCYDYILNLWLAFGFFLTKCSILEEVLLSMFSFTKVSAFMPCLKNVYLTQTAKNLTCIF